MRPARLLLAALAARVFRLEALARLASRRRAPRRPSNLAVDWRVFGSKVHHISALMDLSPTGAFVRAAYPREVGSPLVLDLPIPPGPGRAGGTTRVHARVAWRSPDGMGLRFTRPVAALA